MPFPDNYFGTGSPMQDTGADNVKAPQSRPSTVDAAIKDSLMSPTDLKAAAIGGAAALVVLYFLNWLR